MKISWQNLCFLDVDFLNSTVHGRRTIYRLMRKKIWLKLLNLVNSYSRTQKLLRQFKWVETKMLVKQNDEKCIEWMFPNSTSCHYITIFRRKKRHNLILLRIFHFFLIHIFTRHVETSVTFTQQTFI